MNPPVTAAALAADNIELLRRTIELVRALDDDVYRAAGPVFAQGGIGCHVRHIHDHYRLLLDGLAGGRVDYENRSRDPRIEQDRAFAAAMLEALLPGLAAIPAAQADAALDIQSACGLADDQRWCRSTLNRELAFLVMHDVHHHALMALVLHARGLPAPEDFGLAPSTRRHQQGRPSCAR